MVFQKKGQPFVRPEPGSTTFEEVLDDPKDIGFQQLAFRQIERINATSMFLDSPKAEKSYIRMIRQLEMLLSFYAKQDEEYIENLKEIKQMRQNAFQKMNLKQREENEHQINMTYSEEVYMLMINLLGKRGFLPSTMGIQEEAW